MPLLKRMIMKTNIYQRALAIWILWSSPNLRAASKTTAFQKVLSVIHLFCTRRTAHKLVLLAIKIGTNRQIEPSHFDSLFKREDNLMINYQNCLCHKRLPNIFWPTVVLLAAETILFRPDKLVHVPIVKQLKDNILLQTARSRLILLTLESM